MNISWVRILVPQPFFPQHSALIDRRLRGTGPVLAYHGSLLVLKPPLGNGDRDVLTQMRAFTFRMRPD